MDVNIDLQLALTQTAEPVPDAGMFTKWAQAALCAAGYQKAAEITVRIVNAEEIHQLNQTYRHVDRPTNILSFPFECPPEVELPLLGDLIICHQVVIDEAKAQHKTLNEHYAHLTVHGCLHLLGYDHIQDDEAAVMEALETKVVKALGYKDPYAPQD